MIRRATYSTAVGSDFAEPYADRKIKIDMTSVNGLLSSISDSRFGLTFTMPGGRTVVSAREGANDANIYLEIYTRNWFRVEPELIGVLDGLSAVRRSGARHMRYLFAEEKDYNKEFLESI